MNSGGHPGFNSPFVILGFPLEFIPAKAGAGMTKEAIHPSTKDGAFWHFSRKGMIPHAWTGRTHHKMA
jgi:hypothetical protein